MVREPRDIAQQPSLVILPRRQTEHEEHPLCN